MNNIYSHYNHRDVADSLSPSFQQDTMQAESLLKCPYRQQQCLTLSGVSKLSTHYSGINTVPAIITHCPPLVIDAHLHSTLVLIGASHQTNIAISTVATGNYCREISTA